MGGSRQENRHEEPCSWLGSRGSCMEVQRSRHCCKRGPHATWERNSHCAMPRCRLPTTAPTSSGNGTTSSVKSYLVMLKDYCMFFNIVWRSVGGFGATWGSSRISQRPVSKRRRMISCHVFIFRSIRKRYGSSWGGSRTILHDLLGSVRSLSTNELTWQRWQCGWRPFCLPTGIWWCLASTPFSSVSTTRPFPSGWEILSYTVLWCWAIACECTFFQDSFEINGGVSCEVYMSISEHYSKNELREPGRKPKVLTCTALRYSLQFGLWKTGFDNHNEHFVPKHFGGVIILWNLCKCTHPDRSWRKRNLSDVVFFSVRSDDVRSVLCQTSVSHWTKLLSLISSNYLSTFYKIVFRRC